MFARVQKYLHFSTPRLPRLNQFSRYFTTTQVHPRVYLFQSNNIYWNLATEEYLYENLDRQFPTLLLYRDDKSIVIGRHQNPWKECAIQAMEEDGVAFCRRKSGGGAVYHDMGNSCYSFLTPVAPDVLPLNVKVDNNKVLVRALESLGIPTELSERNDVHYQGKKVSGSAYQASLGKKDGSGRKTLHHGTMLLHADLVSLKKYLNPKKEKLVSKGVDSVKSPTTNLNVANPNLNHELFCSAVVTEFLKLYPDQPYTIEDFTQEMMEKNERIVEIYNEITTFEWKFIKTPEFVNEIEETFDWGKVYISMKVVQGVIEEPVVDIEPSYPDLLEALRQELESKTIVYHHDSFTELFQRLGKQFEKNILYSNILYDLELWAPKAL